MIALSGTRHMWVLLQVRGTIVQSTEDLLLISLLTWRCGKTRPLSLEIICSMLQVFKVYEAYSDDPRFRNIVSNEHLHRSSSSYLL